MLRNAATARSSGTAAISGIPVVQREPVTVDAGFKAALDRGEWVSAVAYLAGRTQQDVDQLVNNLPHCESLLAAVRNDQHHVRGMLLICGFKLAKGNDWSKAARFISTLDDTGIDNTLALLTSDLEVKQLAKGARNTPGGGDDRLLSRIVARLRKSAGQLFGTLVATGSMPRQGVKHAWSFKADEAYKFHMDITFTPDPDVVEATNIAFVQTMSLLKTGTKTSKEDRKHISDRLNSEKQGIDRADYSKYGWYGQREDQKFNKTPTSGVSEGSVVGGNVIPAMLTDEPEGAIESTTWSYETSVIARAGKDAGLVYGVVTWGFVVDDKLQMTAIEPKYRNRPTADFASAVDAWNTQATKDPTTPGQKPLLPAQRSVASDAPTVQRERALPPQPVLGPPTATDAGGRARFGMALQRSVGNAATGLLLSSVQRCGSRVHGDCGCAEQRSIQDDIAIQRQQGPFGMARNEFLSMERKAVLATIQGLPMRDLLPKLAALPANVRTDEAAGQASGGPRLVVAMRAVAAKGKPWQPFVESEAGMLSGLPPDQIGDVVQFLGGSADYGYLKADQIHHPEHGGKFDGSVDPVGGLVTLFFRVQFDTAAVHWGPAAPGTPQAEQEARAGRAKFEADFKRVVESTWSFKGKIKALCPIGKVAAFDTKVVVTVVDADEHTLFHAFSESAEGRSNAGGGEGNLKVGGTEEGKPRTRTVSDPTGKRPVEVTTVQAPAAHEFGHAIGLSHPHCKGSDDDCYGVTAEERRDIMGAGNLLQVIRRGKKAPHDDFAPFEAIAKRWGEDRLTGAMAKCNTWSPA
ncbi:hypothetical protein EP51_39010 (plasmid) [Rhodococcus opacus]|uniref:Uncharacterized protein n=1 Tax=Rhodococcus opacus TaxID=37919 RepID=A0A076EX13_RHOOP|nr:hypothetical protein EP51_39010 [Rhodococcus opacus]